MKFGLLISVAACCLTAAIGFYVGVQAVRAPALPLVSTDPAPVISTEPASSSLAQIQAKPPRIGLVDMQRLFDAHPRTKPGDEDLNAKRTQAKAELQRLADSGDTAAAKQFRESRTKELEAESAALRQQIINDLNARVKAAVARHELNLLLDSSGKSFNRIPIVLYASGLVDLTEEILHDINERPDIIR